MSELLLVSKDLRRAERLARDFGDPTASRIQDLYDDEPFAARPGAIVSDVERLTSDAIIRLRRILGQVRGEDVPYLFLVHGNTARAEARPRCWARTAYSAPGRARGEFEDACEMLRIWVSLKHVEDRRKLLAFGRALAEQG